MANLILPSKSIIQPKNAEIDWNNPLSKGIVFSVNGNLLHDLVNNYQFANNGTTNSFEQKLIGANFVRASNQYVNCGDLPTFDFGSSNFSYEILFRLASNASSTTRMQLLSKDSNTQGRQVWLELNTAADGTTNNSASLVWLNTTLCQTRTPADSIVVGGLTHLIAQRLGNSVEYFLNGAQVTTTVMNGNYPAVSSQAAPVYIGRRAYSTAVDNFDGIIYTARVRNRALSAIEIEKLAKNPWQIFKESKKIVYFFLSSGTTLTPSLFSNTNTFYQPTVTVGSVSLLPGLFSNSNAFYSATVAPGSITLTPSLFSNTNTFFQPVVSVGAVNLLPSLFNNNNTFYAATVTTGSVTLLPSLFSNTNAFYSPTVSNGGLTLFPSLFENSNTFYSHTVTVGSVSLTPSLFENSNTFYNHVVSNGAVTLLPSLFSNTNTFYSATVSSGVVALSPILFENQNVFYSPTVYNLDSFLLPSLLSNSNAFYAATVSPGSVILTPSLFENSNAFYSHTISHSATVLTPSLFSNTNTFYASSISVGGITLLPTLFNNSNIFYNAVVSIAGSDQQVIPGSYHAIMIESGTFVLIDRELHLIIEN